MKTTVPLALLLMVPCSLARAAKPAAVLQELAGNWTLNEELSEDFQGKMRAVVSRSRHPSPLEPRGRGGGDGVRGRGGGTQHGPMASGPGRAADRGSARGTNAPRSYALDAESISILVDGELVTLDYGEGRLRTIGRDWTITSAEEATVKFKARWKNGLLVIKTKAEGVETRERYALSPDRTRLAVAITVELPGLGESVTVVRSFDTVGADR